MTKILLGLEYALEERLFLSKIEYWIIVSGVVLIVARVHENEKDGVQSPCFEGHSLSLVYSLPQEAVVVISLSPPPPLLKPRWCLISLGSIETRI